MTETTHATAASGTDRSRPIRAAAGALGICVGGFVSGVLGLFVVRSAVMLAGIGELDAIQVLSSHYIQFGFAAFAGAYLLRRSDRSRYLQVRRPTLEDLAWIVAIPIAFVLVGALANPLLEAVGLPDPHAAVGTGGIDLLARPALWPVAFVGLYLFAAPAEEAVYRGLVQGRLRPVFGTAGVVAVSGVLFGLMHVLVGLLTPSAGLEGALHWGLSTIPPGLIWAYAYERTRNLVVTAATHAMTWTIPFAALLSIPVH